MNDKVVIIGLDGATFSIIDALIAQGQLPNLSKIISCGVRGKLLSSVPPISAPAWVSFLTGKNPGKHGILGFQPYNLYKYSCFEHSIVSSNTFAKDTIFDILSENNKRSVAFQVPLTYPVWPINGIMVAGYPTPDQSKAFTFPEEYSEKIGVLYDYISDQIAAGSVEEKLQLYSTALERINNTVEELLTREPYDLFVYVSNIPDWVQHKFWKYQFNGKKSRNYIDLFYIKLDEKIGRILKLIDENTTVIVMSDHGAGPRPTKFLNINYLLQENGFLVPTNNKINLITKANKYWFEWLKEYFPMRYWSKASFSSELREHVLNIRVYKDFIDWDKTKAYRVPLAYPYVGVNINLKDRQEKGIISQGKDFIELKQELYLYFKEFSRTNGNYIKDVFRQEELFSGNKCNNIPDLIIELNDNYDSGCEIDRLVTDIPPMLLQTISGCHRKEGIFCAMGKNIVSNRVISDINIVDITPTVLYMLNLPIDEDIDGKVISDIFNEDYFLHNPPVYNNNNELFLASSYSKSISQQEEMDIMAALNQFGYL